MIDLLPSAPLLLVIFIIILFIVILVILVIAICRDIPTGADLNTIL